MNRQNATRGFVGCACWPPWSARPGAAASKRIPTSGTVTLDGKPMTEGILSSIRPVQGNKLRLGELWAYLEQPVEPGDRRDGPADNGAALSAGSR